MTTLSRLSGPNLFQALAIKSGLALYAKTGMKPNTSWTPTAMLKTAGRITGNTYKRGQYAQAIEDIEALLANVETF